MDNSSNEHDESELHSVKNLMITVLGETAKVWPGNNKFPGIGRLEKFASSLQTMGNITRYQFFGKFVKMLRIFGTTSMIHSTTQAYRMIVDEHIQ